jgi:hypothetical protein
MSTLMPESQPMPSLPEDIENELVLWGLAQMRSLDEVLVSLTLEVDRHVKAYGGKTDAANRPDPNKIAAIANKLVLLCARYASTEEMGKTLSDYFIEQFGIHISLQVTVSAESLETESEYSTTAMILKHTYTLFNQAVARNKSGSR